MFKSKLQELCQRESWELPEYATVKDGPDHMPRFTATVTVCGQVFETPAHCKSSKEAQNTAARVAFDSLSAPSPPPPSASSPLPLAACSDAPLHVAEPPRIQPLSMTPDPPPLPLSPFPSSLPDPPAVVNYASFFNPLIEDLKLIVDDLVDTALLATKCNADTKPVKEELLLKEEILQENADDQSQCSIDYRIAKGSESKDIVHMYKNILQQHAQKESIGFPVYTSEAEGLPHARRFKSKVTLNGKSYGSSEFFPTMKEAEQTAARIACQALSVGVIQEDKGLYKNLLQEFVQKKGLMCPSYDTVRSGLPHKPVFVSTVEVGTESFKGAEAKTRKQAEMNAAEVAYCAITNGSSTMNSSKVSFANNFSQDIKPTVTSQKHQTTTDGEDHLLAKRAKSSPENMVVNAHLQSNPPSQNTNPENSISAQPAPDPTVESNPSIKSKTVVFPRKLNWPIPANATVLPYSDDKWVAYKLELDQNPTLNN